MAQWLSKEDTEVRKARPLGWIPRYPATEMLTHGEQHFLIILISSPKRSLKEFLTLHLRIKAESNKSYFLHFNSSYVIRYNGKLLFHVVIGNKNKATHTEDSLV